MELNLYYDEAAHNYSAHGYIGLYKEKSIRAIGKLKKTVLAEEVNGEMHFESESGGMVTKAEKSTILEAVRRAEEYGYNLRTIRHRYFFVEQFYPTDFKKSSYECQLESEPRARLILSHLCSFESEPPKHRSSNNPDGRSPHSYQGHRI